jgi:hypothetical protein
MSLNYFDSTSVSDGTVAWSTINLGSLVTAIQNKAADTYFDSTSKIGTVYVYYLHQDGRQQKKIIHDSTAHQAYVSWSTNARDGTWAKDQLKIFDKDGAITYLYRSDIGTSEDLTHSGGQTTLNNS